MRSCCVGGVETSADGRGGCPGITDLLSRFGFGGVRENIGAERVESASRPLASAGGVGRCKLVRECARKMLGRTVGTLCGVLDRAPGIFVRKVIFLVFFTVFTIS